MHIIIFATVLLFVSLLLDIRESRDGEHVKFREVCYAHNLRGRIRRISMLYEFSQFFLLLSALAFAFTRRPSVFQIILVLLLVIAFQKVAVYLIMKAWPAKSG